MRHSTAAPATTFVVGDLVTSVADTIYLADQSDLDRPAMGVVTRVVATTVYFVRMARVTPLAVAGTELAIHKTLYLGAAGKTTFDAPAFSGGGILRQTVGFTIESLGGGNYEAYLDTTGAAVPS